VLNIGNALGAWLGGVVLAAGLSYAWPSRVAVILPLLGLAVLAVGRWVERRSTR
jgi:MFS transporter, DHA1 family, inner membrane transport protein